MNLIIHLILITNEIVSQYGFLMQSDAARMSHFLLRKRLATDEFMRLAKMIFQALRELSIITR
jgi:hypothetical protein